MSSIRELRNRTIAKKMQYPEHPSHDQWYMFTLPSAPDKDDNGHGKKFFSAWICIAHPQQQNTWHDFGSVKLQSPDFKREWFKLLADAKERVDAMNSQPLDANALCAECGELADVGDFLCESCRNTK